MLDNMNRREKYLMIATIVAVGVYVFWNFGLGTMFDQMTEDGAAVESVKQEFETNLEAMENAMAINIAYASVAKDNQAPPNEKLRNRPDLQFVEEILAVCRKRGFNNPLIAHKDEKIEEVDDYQLINISLKTQGKYKDVANLLLDLEGERVIFREIDMRGTRDRDEVVLDVTIAKISKVPERATRARSGRSRFRF